MTTVFVFTLLACLFLKMDGVYEPNQNTFFGRWDGADPAGRLSVAIDPDPAENN